MLCYLSEAWKKKTCSSQFCSVHGWLFKNRSSMSSEDRRSNIPCTCVFPALTVSFHFCQMYISLLLELTGLIRDYVFLSPLLSPWNLSPTVWEESHRASQQVVLFPPVRDYSNKLFIFWIVCNMTGINIMPGSGYSSANLLLLPSLNMSVFKASQMLVDRRHAAMHTNDTSSKNSQVE